MESMPAAVAGPPAADGLVSNTLATGRSLCSRTSLLSTATAVNHAIGPRAGEGTMKNPRRGEAAVGPRRAAGTWVERKGQELGLTEQALGVGAGTGRVHLFPHTRAAVAGEPPALAQGAILPTGPGAEATASTPGGRTYISADMVLMLETSSSALPRRTGDTETGGHDGWSADSPTPRALPLVRGALWLRSVTVGGTPLHRLSSTRHSSTRLAGEGGSLLCRLDGEPGAARRDGNPSFLKDGKHSA